MQKVDRRGTNGPKNIPNLPQISLTWNSIEAQTLRVSYVKNGAWRGRHCTNASNAVLALVAMLKHSYDDVQNNVHIELNCKQQIFLE